MKSEHEKFFELEKDFFWFKARRELVLELLKQRINRPASLLDVGCGTGQTLLEAKQIQGLSCEGFDISLEAVQFTKRRGIEVQQHDLLTAKFDKEFDFVFCLDVLEHVDEKQGIQQLNRFLKKDGLLFLMVPAFGFLYSNHDQGTGHKKRYEKKDVIGLLKNNGFSIKKCSYWNASLFTPVAIIRLLNKNNNHKENDVRPIPSLLNRFFYRLLKIENRLFLKNVFFPFGLSIIVIAKKEVKP